MTNSYSVIPNQVTAVIPVYNEERYLREALDSVVDQVDCVIIGDNASTDSTEVICREFAAKFTHIRYIRHEINLGAVENTVRLTELVETEYMMQMGGHDKLPDNHVSTLKCLLNANSDAVSAYGNCAYLELDGSISKIQNFASVRTDMLDDDPYIRAATFLRGKQPCDLIFGLFRSVSAIPILLETKQIAGCDHILLITALLDGKLVYTSDTTYLRRMMHPNDTDKDYMMRIVGNHSPKKVSRDYTAAGNEILNRVWKHHDQQVLSPEKKKAFQKLLFQIALKFDTPTGNAFWNQIFFGRKLWRKWCRFIKCKIVPGYADRKNL